MGAFFRVLMFLIATGGAVGDGNTGHTQIPHRKKSNDQRQNRQNQRHLSPSSLFVIQL